MTPKAGSTAGLPDRGRLQSAYEALRPAYEGALYALYQDLRALLEKSGYSPTIKYRIKRFESYCEKLSRSDRSTGEGKVGPVTDLLGIRVVCPFLEDVEEVERLIADNFDVVETVRKAEDHSFREFGYDSLHLVIHLASDHLETILPGTQRVCEIQLRTILQDAWAEVEHELVYKTDITLPNQSIRRKLASLNATLTLSDLIFQELRDYQRQIRQRTHDRRASLANKINLSEAITIAHPSGASPEWVEQLAPMLLTLTSSLEKTMMAALEAHSQGDLETAVELYGKLLGMKLDKSVRSLVYNHRGMAFFVMGDYRRSLKDFTRAISYNGENCRNYGNRGLCYRVLGNYERAIEDYDRALQISPAHLDSRFGLAQTYYDMKLFSKALSECELVLQVDSEHGPAAELARCTRREML